MLGTPVGKRITITGIGIFRFSKEGRVRDRTTGPSLYLPGRYERLAKGRAASRAHPAMEGTGSPSREGILQEQEGPGRTSPERTFTSQAMRISTV